MNTVSIISVCIAGISVIFAIITYFTNRKDKSTDQLEDLKTSLLKLNMKSDQICATTNETRTDIKSMNVKIQDMDTELQVVKRDLQTAFMRIDELKEKQKG